MKMAFESPKLVVPLCKQGHPFERKDKFIDYCFSVSNYVVGYLSFSIYAVILYKITKCQAVNILVTVKKNAPSLSEIGGGGWESCKLPYFTLGTLDNWLLLHITKTGSKSGVLSIVQTVLRKKCTLPYVCTSSLTSYWNRDSCIVLPTPFHCLMSSPVSGDNISALPMYFAWQSTCLCIGQKTSLYCS